MKRLLSLALLAASPFLARADVPPAARLLPQETLLLLSVPEVPRLTAAWEQSAPGQLWHDPSMTAFRADAQQRLEKEVSGPLEKDLGLRLDEYRPLARGQFTLAWVSMGAAGEQAPEMVLLLDTRDRSDQLKTNLVTLKKQWQATGRTVRSLKVGAVEFSVLVSTNGHFNPFLDRFLAPGQKDFHATNLLIGQSDSLLIVTTSAALAEKIVQNQTAATLPVLEGLPSYAKSSAALARDAQAWIWLNAGLMRELLARNSALASATSGESLLPRADQIMAALGLGGLNSVGLAYRHLPEGELVQGLVEVPENQRQGLLKILLPEPKDASPSPLLPASLLSFSRLRLTLPQVWTNLETLVNQLSPSVGGALKLILDAAGKDKDSTYELRRELLSSLGDEVMLVENVPAPGPVRFANTPDVYLIGSTNAPRLCNAFRVAVASLGPEALQERDFLGRKVYSIIPPSARTEPGTDRGVHFAAAGAYVAFSGDAATLEHYLQAATNPPAKLREINALGEAARKVGGFNTGLFGYNNQAELMRIRLATLQRPIPVAPAIPSPSPAPPSVVTNPVVTNQVAVITNTAPTTNGVVTAPVKKPAPTVPPLPIVPFHFLKGYGNEALLPPYESLARYLHFTVYALSPAPEGIWIKFFAPNPPQLKTAAPSAIPTPTTPTTPTAPTATR